jgi:proteasome alpha subunit
MRDEWKMMRPMPGLGYDIAVTMFSPDGRLFQVEYARAAVKRGTTAIGIRGRDGVVLAVDKRIESKLIVPGSVEKLFQIDEHIGVVASGLVADVRVLVDRMRRYAQTNRSMYNEPIDVRTLAKKICDLMQVYTQYGGARPFGTSLLIAGVDPVRLYETDPSGALIGYKATAIGEGRSTAVEFFEEKYSEEMNKEKTMKLALKVLYKVMKGRISEESIDLAIVDAKTQEYTKFSKGEVKRYIAGALKTK